MIFPFSKYSQTSSTAIFAQLSSDSGVLAPKCGRIIIFSCPINSGAAKSLIYLLILPLATLANKSSLLTKSPRAKFKILTPVFICANASLFMKPFVSLVLGTWIVI